MKPILKIKKGNNRPSDYSVTTFNPPGLPSYSVQSGLSAGELGVDLGNNVFYIGNNLGKAITFGCPVDADVNLGSVASNFKIPTQKAVKTYVDTNVTTAPPPVAAPKETFIATFDGRSITSNVAYQFFEIYAVTSIAQTTNMGILYNDQTGTGFYQTSKNFMMLYVNYSLVISSVDSNAIVAEGSTLNAHRSIGLRVINKTNPTATNGTVYYGLKSFLPAIGSEVAAAGLPTLVSGNAVVKLPKYIAGSAEWELQLIYKVRSQDLTLAIADMNNGVNDPAIATGNGLKIEMVKLSESTT